MKLLIDTNVILDVLFNREPFNSDACEILKLSALSELELFVSASAITDIYYIVRKELKDSEKSRDAIKRILEIVNIAGVSSAEISNALSLAWKDFEDSVQYSVAYLQGMDGIVTRNPRDYEGSRVKIYEPQDALQNFGRDDQEMDR